MKMLLTGEPIDAETALRIGLVEEVVDDAEVLTRREGAGAEDRIVQPGGDAGGEGRRARGDLDAARAGAALRERTAHRSACPTRRAIEGIKAFQEKREGKF